MRSCKELQKQANATKNRCADSTPSVGTTFGFDYPWRGDLRRWRRDALSRVRERRMTEQNHGSLPHRCADHLQHATQAVIAAHTAFVKRSPLDGLPLVT